MIERRIIPIEDLSLDRYTSRELGWINDESDQELLASLRGLGLIQDIIVRRGEEEGKFKVIAGWRRKNGMEKAGVKEVACKVLELNDLEALKTSIGENVGRKELTHSERMKSINTWYHMIEDPTNIKPGAKYDRVAIKEIALVMYGRDSDAGMSLVVQQLRLSSLPRSLRLLLKKPEERTVQENLELKEVGVDPYYSVDYATLDRIGSVGRKLGLEDAESTEEAEKQTLAFISEAGLADKSRDLQLEIISNFNEQLEEKGSYALALKELKESIAVGLKSTVNVTLRIPANYLTWHKRLMEETHAKNNIELVRKVYLEYLDRESKKRGWV